eukprot:Em0020g395a
MRLPPARNLETTEGTFPDARRFTISLREEQIVFCNVTSAAFSRCWIRNLDGPHAVAFGKDLKTDKILKSGGRIGGLSGLAPDSSQHLSDAVGMFNWLVPAEDSIKVEDFLSSAISQGKLSEKLDNHLLSSLVEASTVVNKARLLSVSSPHAPFWLSMPPCERQGLHLEPSQFQVAVKWWLGLDTSGDAQCALCPEKSLNPLGHHATTCKRGGDVVYRHNRLRDIVAKSCRGAHLTDILIPHWCMGKPAALDLSVTSPLNPLTLLEAGVTAGAAAKATEERKLKANTSKCADLGWVCVPVVAESYGAWGLTARYFFSKLGSRLATSLGKSKSVVTHELYGRMSMNLVRANATVILSRSVPPPELQ